MGQETLWWKACPAPPEVSPWDHRDLEQARTGALGTRVETVREERATAPWQPVPWECVAAGTEGAVWWAEAGLAGAGFAAFGIR